MLRKKFSNYHLRWSDYEDKFLLKNYYSKTAKELSEEFQRPISAINSRYKKLTKK